MNQTRDQTRPAALMASSQAPACVAIEELVEPKVVLPMRIEIEQVITGIDAPPAILVPGHQMLQPVLDFLGDVAQVHEVTASRGTFDLEIVSVEEEEALERLDQQEVDTQPDRSSPVAITTEKAAVRVSRNVAHRKRLSVDFHFVWIFLVIFR